MTTADALRIEIDSVEVRHLTAVGAIPGVVPLLAAARNGPGVGAIQCGSDGVSLTWRAPGSATFGSEIACSPDGTYILPDGEAPDKWLRVQVYGEYLNAGEQADVLLADVYNDGVAAADVTAEEAQVGDVLEYSLALRNATANSATNLRLWIDPAAETDTEISLDGVTWSRPTTEADGLCLAYLAGESSQTIYLRRTIAAGASSASRLRVHLHIRFDML